VVTICGPGAPRKPTARPCERCPAKRSSAGELVAIVPAHGCPPASAGETPPWAARTIAKIPALMASGSVGQTSTTAAKSGSIGPVCAPSAPDCAPLWSSIVEFPAESCDSSNPVPAITPGSRLSAEGFFRCEGWSAPNKSVALRRASLAEVRQHPGCSPYIRFSPAALPAFLPFSPAANCVTADKSSF
jgi:hypothetical protein